MSKIQKKRNKRITFRIFLVAAILVALGATVATADRVWGVSGIFFGNMEEKLSAEDVETIDQLGASFAPEDMVTEDAEMIQETNDGFTAGITSNGATITPISVLGDDHYFHLHLRVDAPEGTVLPDDRTYQLHGMELGTSLKFLVPRSVYTDISSEMTVETLPDEDPTDNVKEFMIKWYAIDDHVDIKFNDGVSKILVIRGLWEQITNGVYKEVFTGEFVFDIGRFQLLRMAKPDVAGISDENAKHAITFKSMTVTPLGITYVYTEDAWYEETLTGDFVIVKKDGTVIKTLLGMTSHDAATGMYESTARFSDYVALDDMDYIVFGTTKIPVEPIPIELTPIPEDVS